jgi:hypothetical protein
MDPEDDDDDQRPCEGCCELHPIGVLEDGWCPDCIDNLGEEDWP